MLRLKIANSKGFGFFPAACLVSVSNYSRQPAASVLLYYRNDLQLGKKSTLSNLAWISATPTPSLPRVTWPAEEAAETHAIFYPWSDKSVDYVQNKGDFSLGTLKINPANGWVGFKCGILKSSPCCRLLRVIQLQASFEIISKGKWQKPYLSYHSTQRHRAL